MVVCFSAPDSVHFSCLAPVASFPALYFTYLLLARNWLCLFHWFKLLASFPARGAGCVFSHAGKYLHHFPRSMAFCLFARPDLHPLPGLTPVQSFPYLTQVAFFIALCPVPFFPRLNQLASSFAVDAGSIFSRVWTNLHPLTRLTPAASFPALNVACILFRAWHWSRSLHQLQLRWTSLSSTFSFFWPNGIIQASGGEIDPSLVVETFTAENRNILFLGCGKTGPDPSADVTLEDGTIVPVGKGCNTSFNDSSLLYNEYPFIFKVKIGIRAIWIEWRKAKNKIKRDWPSRLWFSFYMWLIERMVRVIWTNHWAK